MVIICIIFQFLMLLGIGFDKKTTSASKVQVGRDKARENKKRSIY